MKLQIAVTFAFLFFLSCCAVFILAVSAMIYSENRDSLAEMQNIAENIEKVYILGARFNSTSIVTPGVLCPEDARQKVLKEYPGSKILFYVTQNLPEKSSMKGYSLIYTFRNGHFYELIQRKNGAFISREINPRNDMRALTRYFLLVLGEYAEGEIELEIRNPDATQFLDSEKLGSGSAKGKKWEKTGFLEFGLRLPDGKMVQIRKQKNHFSEINRKYMDIFFFSLISIALAGILVSWLITGRFIRGVRRMTLEMRKIAVSGNYTRKINSRRMNQDQEIRELMETFNEMNEKTLSLMEDLKMVSNNVAHDLRTPVTRIAGTMEELLRERDLPEKVIEPCASVIEECMRIKMLVNTILDISRVNSNPGLLKKESLDLSALLDDFCDIMLPEAERKGLRLILNLPEEPIVISADRICVQRIISNLMENALKFTKQGNITVVLERKTKEIHLSVKDSGCGIPEKDISHIFDRFYRGDSSRKYPGNGLGLSLVLAFVRAHGWKISCTSEYGSGTQFLITIPFQNS